MLFFVGLRLAYFNPERFEKDSLFTVFTWELFLEEGDNIESTSEPGFVYVLLLSSATLASISLLLILDLAPEFFLSFSFLLLE